MVARAIPFTFWKVRDKGGEVIAMGVEESRMGGWRLGKWFTSLEY